MTSIWTDIENLFEPEEAALAAFIHGMVSDVTAWAKKEETIIVADIQIWWGQNKLIIGQYSASQLAILQGLVQTAAADAAAGDYSAIVAAVTTQAATQELAWVTALTTAELASVVAFLSYKPAPPAA
jgi:hypothetical protein